MLYAKRNADGRIIGLSDTFSEEADVVDINHPEVKDFLSIHNDDFKPNNYLDESDLAVARILDDLVDLLVKKNIIMFTELPDQAQRKLLSRRVVRSLIQESKTDQKEDNSQPTASNNSFLSDDESIL